MPPKAKQAARRANAKAAAKGVGKGHVPLDEAAERANFERLCPQQRGRIQELPVPKEEEQQKERAAESLVSVSAVGKRKRLSRAANLQRFLQLQ